MNKADIYAEVYEVLIQLGDKYINKLPKKLFQFINENRNKKSIFEFDISKSIDEQNLSNETISFIQLLNSKYWQNK